MLSTLPAVPSCIYSFWHGVIPISYFRFFFTDCFRRARGKDAYMRVNCVHSVRTVSMFGNFSTEDVLTIICDDKIVREVYFLETYYRNSSHFPSSSGALANTRFCLRYFRLIIYGQPSLEAY